MKKILLPLFAIALFITSCKKENLDSGLFGTWNVTQVSGIYYLNGSVVASPVDNNPTGTIKFNSNGTGKQDYSFSLYGSTYPQTSNFVWEADDSKITIDRTDEPDMEWTRVTNESNKQVATYRYVVNASQSWDYTLTLEK